MKCPYICHEVSKTTSAKPDIIEYTPKHEDIFPVVLANTDQTIVTYSIPIDCLGPECAAWFNGRCGRVS